MPIVGHRILSELWEESQWRSPLHEEMRSKRFRREQRIAVDDDGRSQSSIIARDATAEVNNIYFLESELRRAERHCSGY
jgi:hypothetical protein